MEEEEETPRVIKRRGRRDRRGEEEEERDRDRKKEVTRCQKWKNLSAKFSSSPERETEKESNVVHKRPFCCFSAH